MLLWLPTPAAQAFIDNGQIIIDPIDDLLRLAITNWRESVEKLRAWITENPGRHAIILDVGNCSEGRSFVFVKDSINRSGENPLRGLGGMMERPFLDIGELYSIPEPNVGIVADCYGGRNHGKISAGVSATYLHQLAIVAHLEKLPKYGIVVDAALDSPLSMNKTWLAKASPVRPMARG